MLYTEPRPNVTVKTLAEAEALPPDKWFPTLRTWRDAPHGTLERFAHYIGCYLCGTVGKEAEHRAIVAKGARSWMAKHLTGKVSCAWHEISEALGTLDTCPCMACVKERDMRARGPAYAATSRRRVIEAARNLAT